MTDSPPPLPDLPVYWSWWRAALLSGIMAPFLLCGIALIQIVIDDAPAPDTVTIIALLLGTALGVAWQFWVFRYRPSRGPMYVFTSAGLIVGRQGGGEPIPWPDVWISWIGVTSATLTTHIDYLKPAFRSAPYRAGGPGAIYRDRTRHRTLRRVVMPNISTLGNRGLERMRARYAAAAGVPDDDHG